MSNPWDAIHDNHGLTISIHLSEIEVGNINGWVNRGFSDPAFANYPGRLVLEERTRARFDQVSAQFVAAGLCSPSVPPPVPQPEPPTPPTLAVDMQPEIAFGDYSRKSFVASTEYITVFPFVLPERGVVHLAASEFRGQPWARLLTVSMVPGDLRTQLRSAGKVPDLYVSKYDFPPRTLLYANTVLTEEPTVTGSSGSGFSIVWPAP